MVRCIYDEPIPPDLPEEFEAWCESGKSGRPIQTHLGDSGIVSSLPDDENTIMVQFDDGDERILHLREVRLYPLGRD